MPGERELTRRELICALLERQRLLERRPLTAVDCRFVLRAFGRLEAGVQRALAGGAERLEAFVA